MRTKWISLVSAALFPVLFGGVAFAQQGHSHEAPGGSKETGAKDSTPAKGSVQTVTVEGLIISLDLMSMGDHMKHTTKGSAHGEADHSKSHSLMVTLQDVSSKEIISDARVAFVISGPAGTKDSGELTWSGDHYAAGISMKDKGNYQIDLLVESGGMERVAKWSYEFK
jgi:hypothetical protein